MNTVNTVFPVEGIRLGTTCAGIRKPDKPDLVVMAVADGSHCAAVFTRNAFCAAPVVVAKEHLASNSPRYLVINTGYANAGTGERGLAASRQTCDAVARLTGCQAGDVLPFSTGIIGEPLPLEVVLNGLPAALAGLSENGWARAATGIMTTDTMEKLVSRSIELGGRTVTVTGMAKGAGMIRPDMATMLAFVATDAMVERRRLQECLQRAVEQSFNRITVDGDTSTNDACVLIATGCAGGGELSALEFEQFTETVSELCRELARAIVRDGEGATKLITVRVEEGRDPEECSRVAYTVAHSPLVKTAFFAGDPNWGRILAAIGRAPLADLDVSRIDIFLDEVRIVHCGAPDSAYREARGAEVMSRDEITIRVGLGRGNATSEIWTCDLSYDYIRINAEYRT